MSASPRRAAWRLAMTLTVSVASGPVAAQVERLPSYLQENVSGAELLAALCERDGVCPRFLRLTGHNHLSEVAAFNTPDEQLGREVLDFMRRGR